MFGVKGMVYYTFLALRISPIGSRILWSGRCKSTFCSARLGERCFECWSFGLWGLLMLVLCLRVGILPRWCRSAFRGLSLSMSKLWKINLEFYKSRKLVYWIYGIFFITIKNTIFNFKNLGLIIIINILLLNFCLIKFISSKNHQDNLISKDP